MHTTYYNHNYFINNTICYKISLINTIYTKKLHLVAFSYHIRVHETLVYKILHILDHWSQQTVHWLHPSLSICLASQKPFVVLYPAHIYIFQGIIHHVPKADWLLARYLVLLNKYSSRFGHTDLLSKYQTEWKMQLSLVQSFHCQHKTNPDLIQPIKIWKLMGAYSAL